MILYQLFQRRGHSVQFHGLQVPVDNTCTKVLELLANDLKQCWQIDIQKNIPAGAGLGVAMRRRC